MTVRIAITVDTSGLTRLLSSLRASEIPTAARNILNDVAREVVQREREEIKRVFNRPTPLIQNSPRVKTLAKPESLMSEVWLKDVFRSGTQSWSGDPVFRALTPHIPGFPNTRMQKGMEGWLKNAGLMKAGEWLMPARGYPLDRYGNVTGAQAQKMLADVRAYRGVAGMPGATLARNRKYVWGTKQAGGGHTVKGIWTTKGRRGGRHYQLDKLMMVVVSGAPTYAKRFRFHDVGRLYAERIIPRLARLAIEHSIRRRHGQ